jgi:hypothetical protein
LVPDLAFKSGVTTLVAPSGEGKTTLSFCLGLMIDTGGLWGEVSIKPRSMLWVAGEGRDDLRPIYEACLQANPQWGKLKSTFFDEAIDLSSDWETNKLIKRIEGREPLHIVTDALADMIGDLDEDKSKDINRVYRNVWRVVRANNGSFWVPHHAGWEKGRERGSTAIRAKSDIVLYIDKFEPEAGKVVLKHLKRRGGPKLKEIGYEVKLITVDGYQ